MTATGRARRIRGDGGNVSLFVVLLLPALMLAAGLVLDGGRQIQVRREAHGIAAAAARAGVQLSSDEVYGRGLDAGQAAGRARAELARLGGSGSVAVNGTTVTVTVTAGVDYVLLPGSGSVSQRASASPVDGVRGGLP